MLFAGCILSPVSCFLSLLASSILSSLCALACYFAAGVSLGLFLGSLIFATILTPPLALIRERVIEQGLAVAGVVLGIGTVWFVAVMRSEVTFGQWLQCVVVLGALLLALWGLASPLARACRSPVHAAAITVFIALMWMTWPVWLSRGLVQAENSERIVARLVPLHPPLVMSTLLDMGVWGEQPVAYHLTTLGQDIIYLPPRQPWATIVVHAGLGAALLFASWSIRAKPPRRRAAAADDLEQTMTTPS